MIKYINKSNPTLAFGKLNCYNRKMVTKHKQLKGITVLFNNVILKEQVKKNLLWALIFVTISPIAWKNKDKRFIIYFQKL